MLKTIDLHAAGEPARVVVSGLPKIKGVSMAEKRIEIMQHHDNIRKLLLLEPRGYPCQNANLIFPSAVSGVSFGFVILEQNKIYPMMSGHNTICVATALLQSEMIPFPEGGTGDLSFKLEAPGGVIPITATCVNRKVKSITLTNVPSFVARRDVEVQVPELGAVVVDIVYSGMWYCVVDTKRMIRASLPNFPLTPDNGKEICKYGEMIKVACREQYPVHHPLIEYTGCDILVFCSPGASETVTSGSTSKNAVVMSNNALKWDDPNTFTGMLDRSPCGTGTCAVMARLFFENGLELGQNFVHESIIGSQFTGRLISKTKVGVHDAVVGQITGTAWVTQYCDVVVDPEDPFPEGYTVADIWG